jgi:hypothetical protein
MKLSNKTMILLHDGSKEKFKLPLNFDIKSQNFDIFKSIDYQHSPNIYLYYCNNALIDDKCIVYDYYGNILYDLYEPSEKIKYIFDNRKRQVSIENIRHPRLLVKNILKLSLSFFKTQSRLNDNREYIVITDDRAINNIYHWLCDAFIRLLAYGELGKNQVLLIPEDCWNHEYVRFSLRLIGVNKSNICLIKRNKCYRVKSIHYVTNSIYTPSSSNGFLINKVRDLMRNHIENNGLEVSDNTKRVYLSRSNSYCRDVSNKEDFNNFIESYNFVEISAEDHTLSELISILYNTRCVMGVVGAALTHMILMKKGSFVIELIHSNFVTLSNETWPNKYKDKYYGLHYSYLSNSLGMHYLYVPCKAIQKKGTVGPIDQDLIVDLAQLKEVMKIII